jgi:hypothetical protein
MASLEFLSAPARTRLVSANFAPLAFERCLPKADNGPLNVQMWYTISASRAGLLTRTNRRPNGKTVVSAKPRRDAPKGNEMNPDFSIENHGSVFLFRMNTHHAFEMVDENLQSDAQFFADALVVEHRYARDLARGIAADGLVIA